MQILTNPRHLSKSVVDLMIDNATIKPLEDAYVFIGRNEQVIDSITFHDLYCRSSHIASILKSNGNMPGDRIIIMYPSNLSFIVAFLGVLQAEMIAVPVMDPKANEGTDRIFNIINDSQASALLTTTDILNRVERININLSSKLRNLYIDLEDIESNNVVEYHSSNGLRDRPAFLQYTSGSTGTPKGVVVTHGNLLNNQKVIANAFGHDSDTTVVGWLPMYHDMGLIGNVLQPLYLGKRCILMSPLDFLVKPQLWFKAITKYHATTSGGPNFAYELCCERIKDKELTDIDLSTWKVAFNGAEPVRASTMIKFASKYIGYGFNIKSFYPCYGLAESTLFVTGGESDSIAKYISNSQPSQLSLDIDSKTLDINNYVSSGHVWDDTTIEIVDNKTLDICKPNEIGEIWISSPSVCKGYWSNLSRSTETFDNKLEKYPNNKFLKTGDQGFIDTEGNLYVVGRYKDIVIIRGTNHYAEDIEEHCSTIHDIIRNNRKVAFSIDHKDEERLVLLFEEGRKMTTTNHDVLKEDIKESIIEKFGVCPYIISFVKYGSIPVTTSGKTRRQICKKNYLENSIEII